MFSTCSVTTSKPEETRLSGRSLALSLYRSPLVILLSGELGAGKTTFAQGFASGLGVEDRVLSPSYALEQRYDGFTHIDLYRLDRKQAEQFLAHSDDLKGIRLIEWAERIDPAGIGPHIFIRISDDNGLRTIDCHFKDETVPTDAEIEQWYNDVRLPSHIREHCKVVAKAAGALGKILIRSHKLLRPEALHAAAMTHDLLRFLDFKDFDDDAFYKASKEDKEAWQKMLDLYGKGHEDAARKFLCDKGFSAVGEIVRTHAGLLDDGSLPSKTIEQKILAYADKRVRFSETVTLDERFDDFMKRYGNGVENDFAKKWRVAMKTLERELFPEGAPAL